MKRQQQNDDDEVGIDDGDDEHWIAVKRNKRSSTGGGKDGARDDGGGVDGVDPPVGLPNKKLGAGGGVTVIFVIKMLLSRRSQRCLVMSRTWWQMRTERPQRRKRPS